MPPRAPRLPLELGPRRTDPDLALEARFRALGYEAVCGVDEAGRGTLAGPVVAAAVLVGDPAPLQGVRDSKALTRAQREGLFLTILRETRGVGVGVVSHRVIDRLDILTATRLAMARAMRRLRAPVQMALIDGSEVPGGPVHCHPVVKGDRRSLSIAAASVVAKVVRDLIMERYERVYPGYGFGEHKGYATASHRDAIRRHGPSPVHRLSFRL